MAKKKTIATKEEKGMVIYLKEDGLVAKVDEGNEIVLGDFEYAIVAGVQDNRINGLKLYRDGEVCVSVNDALMNAFEYDCKRTNSGFLGEFDKLREIFLEKAGRLYLTRDEKIEIKKYMFATYIHAKN